MREPGAPNAVDAGKVAQHDSAQSPDGVASESALAAAAYRGVDGANSIGEKSVGKRPSVAAAMFPSLKRGLIRVTSALAAGWVLGYALKLPIESQARRARRWFARF